MFNKLFVIIMLILMVLFLFVGCAMPLPDEGVAVVDGITSYEQGLFKSVYYYHEKYEIVYHVDTKVMYVVSRGYRNNYNFTLLVNADGSPMIYEGGDIAD